MKKFLSVILSICLFALSVLLVGCGKGDKYELFSVSGLGVSTAHYEYNYIKFDFEDNTYELKNKAKMYNIEIEQTGSFTFVYDTEIVITNNEIPSQNYFLYGNEKLYFSNDYQYFYAEAYIYGEFVKMVYKKA